MDNIRGGVRGPAPISNQSAPSSVPPVSSAGPLQGQYNRFTPSSNGNGSSPSKAKRIIIIIAAVIVLALIALVALLLLRPSGPQGIDTGKYQAIFFTNGQVYFGKLENINGNYMKLTKVFYLQAKNQASDDQKNPQQTTQENADIQLIKLGDEVHGPQDEMIISKEQVLFYENLKPEGKVATSIDQYLNKK